MSTSSAIATVTATLRHLLEQATSADDVTTLPPGIARAERIGTQINVFLYKTDINTAFSNFPMPGTAMQNEMSAPPLALSLRYLLTSYGDNNDDISGQQIIGESMLATRSPGAEPSDDQWNRSGLRIAQPDRTCADLQ